MTEVVQSVEGIPQIPEELLLYDIDKIIGGVNKFGATRIKNEALYSTHEVSSNIHEFLSPYFDGEIDIRYQVIKTQLPIHIDNHATHIFNYVLLTGGDKVLTRWWNMPKEKQLVFKPNVPHDICRGDDQDDDQLIYETLLPLKKWYKLQVSIPHDISIIETPRLGITVWEKKDEITSTKGEF